ncbi:zinc finger protein 1-like [Silene latifolia]|uniref:zinc finger protein 1-like n=1 Tax=Silene latifolia TaxID=37657 RepID=UPI003D76EA97
MTSPNISNPLPSSQHSKPAESHQNHNKNDLVLDLSLCGNEMEQGFDPKSSNSDRFNLIETHTFDKTSQGNEGEPRVFSCNYCQRKFYSSQALGGHQNAHKRERTLAKRGRRIDSTSFGNYYPDNLFKGRPLTSIPYPSKITVLPLHGSYNTPRPLGIQAHSLIQKPSTNMAFSSTISLQNGWSRMPMIDQHRPVLGRLAMGSSDSSPSPNGEIARFGGVQKNSPTSLDRNIGGISWKGISPNVLKNYSSISSSNQQDHDHLQKLDLSLKL